MRLKSLLLENVHPLAAEALAREGVDVVVRSEALRSEQLIKELHNCQILGIRSRTRVSKEVLNQAKDLLVLGAFCVGTNQIDLQAAQEVGVAVFNAPYSNTRSVVELAIGEMIMLMRKVGDKSRKMHQGEWDKSAKGSHELRGKKLGIVGYGNIGSQLSVVAEALGMEVYFYDLVDKLAMGTVKKCWSLEELLPMVDVVSVHVDGRASNQHLIGEREFGLMKEGAIFLNLSRGSVVEMACWRKR